MCYDITLTNIQMQHKRAESVSPLLPFAPRQEIPSFLFVPVLTLNRAFAEPPQIANQQKLQLSKKR